MQPWATILNGAEQWRQVGAQRKPALKILFAPTKFYECPLSAITPHTWALLGILNNSISAESGDLLQLWEPGSQRDQPAWFMELIRIGRSERAGYRAWRMKQPAKKES